MALTATEEALVRQLIDQQAAILSLAGNESTITSKLGATKVTLADLPNAPSIGDPDLFLIRQGSQEKNVTGAVVKALASASVSGATTTAAGIIEIATDAEVKTGTDADRAVTPSGMSSRTATETRTGILEIANASEVLAGTDNDRAVTAAKLLGTFIGAGGVSGTDYVKIPFRDKTSGVRRELVVQWLTTSSIDNNSSSAISWPIAFPNAAIMAFTTIKFAGTTTKDAYSIENLTTSGATVYATGAGGPPAFVVAIGY